MTPAQVFSREICQIIRTCFSQNTFQKITSVVFKKSHTWEEGGVHLRSSFWHLLMSFEKPEKSKFWKNEKKKKKVTLVYQKPQLWGSWDTELEFFCHFGPFFALYLPPRNNPDQKTNIWKNEKSIWRCHHFELEHQKTNDDHMKNGF